MDKLYLDIKAIRAEKMIRSQANVLLHKFENDDMFDGNEEGYYIRPKFGEPYWQNKELFERQHLEIDGLDTTKENMMITDKDAMRIVEGINTQVVDGTLQMNFELCNGYFVKKESSGITKENVDEKRIQLIQETKDNIRFAMILMFCLGIYGVKNERR